MLTTGIHRSEFSGCDSFSEFFVRIDDSDYAGAPSVQPGRCQPCTGIRQNADRWLDV
jgi:hypothetical protein